MSICEALERSLVSIFAQLVGSGLCRILPNSIMKLLTRHQSVQAKTQASMRLSLELTLAACW